MKSEKLVHQAVSTAGSRRSLFAITALLAAGALSACVDSGMTAPNTIAAPDRDAAQSLTCKADLLAGTVRCANPSATSSELAADYIGGQNTNVTLTATNIAYNSGTEIFSFDATIQNLMNEAIGTPDGTQADPNGIRAFLASGPIVTGGSGTASVANADGTATFTSANQPYFQYNTILSKDAVSAAKEWRFNVPATATSISFSVLLMTDMQPLLVINEMLTNPGGTISDSNGEWIEIYNAGSRDVNMENLVIADSAASGRRPYHLISSSLVVPSGGYVVIGNTTNTTNNGGVPVDYAFGAAVFLANSLDAFKISRVVGTDTLTLDRVQYASAATSSQNGISRELKNPALNNADMDGSNWSDALVSAVYGPGGRGTPKAQNSGFTPSIVEQPVFRSMLSNGRSRN